ncbi:MAG: AmmeMemoRadiSam system protein B [Phycisphaerales bacterium]|nr:AmmeMemoRadiSam system protein B [Phycisphaerales bacterium]
MMDPNTAPGQEGDQPEPAKFDPDAAHMQRPKIRSVQGFPVQHQGKMLLGLRDPSMLSERIIFTVPAVANLFPLMDGAKAIDEIVAEVGKGLTVQMLQQLVAQLDGAMLLEGPVFDAHLSKLKTDFDESENLPPASTAALVDMIETNARRQAYMVKMQGEGKVISPQELMAIPESQLADLDVEPRDKLLKVQMDAWIDKALEKAEDPSFDALPKAIVSPHLDYQRGWPNYASVYGRLRVVDRPDRIIILGANHFGRGTGVVGCDKGFESPMGVCKLDREMFDQVVAHMDKEQPGLGEKLLEQQFDHEREHSIELQLMWIQHVFGKDASGEYPPVLAMLMHDISKTQDGDSYDGEGVGLMPTVAAIKSAMSQFTGKILVVTSADLSHIGPQYGDKQPVDEKRRDEVAKFDHEMLQLLIEKRPEEMVSSMAWQQNPTRWCSIGNLVATMRIVEPDEVKVLSYGAAADPQGMACVTSAAMVMR